MVRRRDVRKAVPFSEFELDAARNVGNAVRAMADFRDARDRNLRPRFYQDGWGNYVVEIPPTLSERLRNR